MKNKHITEIDFIRIICALGIIIYHFSCYTNSILHDQIQIGNIIVSIFFLVSGFVLYVSNKEIKSLKRFYYKRFKSIYPMFWLLWLIFYIHNVFKVRSIFYAGNPLKLLLTFFAIDGYFIQRIVNYYTIGEWFLGALIFAYLLYPLLLKGIQKNPFLALIVLFVLHEIILIFNLPVISPGFPSITESCLYIFLGMLLNKYWKTIYNNKNIIISVIILVISAILYKFLPNEMKILISTSLFIILFYIGNKLINEKNKLAINKLSTLTYPVFLLQHQAILSILYVFNPNSLPIAVVVLFLCIMMTFILAYIASFIIDKLLNTKLYKSFEEKILEG